MKNKIILIKFLKTLIVFGLFTCAAITKAIAKEENKKPNIIFIFADDLGFGDLGCYGNKIIRTPFIDKMASEGLLFTNFSVASPVCSPSRVGIMTGQYPARNRIHYALSNDEAHNLSFKMPNYLDPKVQTLTRLLKAAGYTTAHFGKWHLGASNDAPLPREYGIDESRTHGSRTLSREELCYEGVEPADKSEKLIDITIDFIERHKNESFYINCWLSDPHSPLAPSDKQLAEYPELKSMTRGFTSATQVYSAVITNLDKQIGRLLEKLDQLGLSENTLIVFSSDNGPSPIFGIDTAHSGTGSVGPLRGCKASLYEGGIRVPFIVRWPGHVPEGKVDDETVISGVDLLPTFCSFANVDYDKDLKPDGEDMSYALLGSPTKRKNPLMWQYRFSPWGRHIQKSPALAMRDGDWKLMMNPDGSRTELYNLKENPCEVDNLANEYPKIVKRMSKKLLEWNSSLPDVESMPETAGSFYYPWPKAINSQKQ